MFLRAWSLVFSFVRFYHPCLFSFRMGNKADIRGTARKRNGLHRRCSVSFFFFSLLFRFLHVTTLGSGVGFGVYYSVLYAIVMD